MLPSLLSQEIINGLKQYLITGWEPSNSFFKDLMKKYSDTEGNLFKGPYISVGLPFLKGAHGKDFFTSFETSYPPYAHQEKAWKRLSSDTPLSTIIATGTGSGKTECFLYPLLDYCVRNLKEKGIKAIIIYPMNALASDQAARMAEFISSRSSLKGKLRVGLFIGDSENNASGTDRMGDHTVITKKDVLRKNPPDILLTNYKMLDYLLLRPQDRPLWKQNKEDTLKYLVVDELHTFDGAQGTDLALLIRRLRARLKVKESLVCVGTSATLGGNDDINALLRYAGDVFEAEFSAGSIIGEERESAEDFLGKSFIEHQLSSVDGIMEALDPEKHPSIEHSIKTWYRLFFDEPAPEDINDPLWRASVGRKLKSQLQFYNLLRSLDGKIKDINSVSLDIAKTLPSEIRASAPQVLDALIALCSWARDQITGKQPFVQIRYQLWARELRRMVCRVSSDKEKVVLVSSDDIDDNDNSLFLPLIQCSECHTTGWLGRIAEGENKMSKDLKAVYNSFFAHQPDETLLFPDISLQNSAQSVNGYDIFLCGDCGSTRSNIESGTRVCNMCGSDNIIKLFKVDEIEMKHGYGGRNYRVSKHICPVCGKEETLLLIGARSATLSSTAIAHTWASRFNDDKKMIAFSDSVQDAAHRAGFFGARTYSTNVRIAILQAIIALGGDISWTELLKNISDFWMNKEKNPKALSKQQFVVEFIGPNITDDSDYENMKLTGVVSDNLEDLVRKRLEWEVFSEFTYNSERGRALERVGVAALSIDEKMVSKTLIDIAKVIREEFGLRNASDDSILCFLYGILYHLKNNGGVYHEFLHSYIEQGSKEYSLNRLGFTPNFGKHSPRPVFLKEQKRANYETFTSRWYKNWLYKCFKDDLVPQNIESNLYGNVMGILLRHGILLRNDDVYSLNPDGLYITTDTVLAGNNSGGSTRAVPRKIENIFSKMPLFESGNTGFFKIKEDDDSEHWLNKVYRTGSIRRVIAAEHTGLLERSNREELERRFNGKEEYRPWFENLLSATPTLEMGIDIGDLPTVLLCQIPPSQANYLQRIGRAGRKDGNAFTISIATGNPHDLYFYAKPEEMFLGKVNPPGVFLNASMVLFRQLIAFCFDKWVETGIDRSSIPEKLRWVLDNVEKSDLQKFPYNLISYIKGNKEEIFNDFIELLPNISQKAKDALHQFLFGGEEKKTFEYYLVERLATLSEERKRFKVQTEMMKYEIQKIAKEVQDEATREKRKEIERNRDSMLKMLMHINEKETLNFMTDEGLLPNYSFPESGVTLRSVIWKRKSKIKEFQNNKVFEYERPASSAISEFAPENKFYATGRKIEVEQIDMKISKIEEWRFCSSCTYAENVLDGKDEYKECPNCGDPNWSDVGQKMMLVKLKQVLATTEDSDSRIGDDSEDREPVFYTKHLLPVFKQNDVEKAYYLENEALPFGFEFIKNVTLREINFGKYGDITGQVTKVAGKELVRPGFRICKYCGKVQKVFRRDGEREHAFKCEAENGDREDAIVDCLYLYREFESEALRIMVPSTRFAGDDKALHSMIAALQLGLKLRYKGRIDHLKITTYEESDRVSDSLRTYILLYDSVPGGTGYLHDLLYDSSALIEVFQLARDKMVSCRCVSDPEKDGCYECLFAYRLSHGMEKTSRSTAVAILSEIIDKKSFLKEVENISSISTFNPFFGSELEARFIEALKIMGNKSATTKIQPDIVQGKPGYFMQVGENSYLIEPQAELNEKNGVSVPSRPDFLIKPAKKTEKMLPVAVFLDGFTYHKNSLSEDAVKRLSIVRSNNYLVWNLTWDDVESIRKNKLHNVTTIFSQKQSLNQERFSEDVAKRLGVESEFSKLHLNQCELLVELLKRPAINHWMKAVFSKVTGTFAPSDLQPVKKELIKNFPEHIVDEISKETDAFLKEHRKERISVLNIMHKDALTLLNPDKLFSLIILDGKKGFDDKASWQTFLATINIIQVTRRSFWATTEGLEMNDYSRIPWTEEELSDKKEKEEWQTVLDEVSTEMTAGIKNLMNKDLPIPLVGFEMIENASVVAEAELAWLDQKIAVLRTDQKEMIKVFTQKGWKVVEENENWSDEIFNYIYNGAEK